MMEEDPVEIDWYDMYPERPVDYEGMWKVISEYNDRYYYGE